MVETSGSTRSTRLAWARPVTPQDLTDGRLLLVPGGAVSAGARADALVEFDHEEVGRRAADDVPAVRSVPLLDALLNLPLGYPVELAELSEREARLLGDAPPGCVTIEHGRVTRVVRSPLTVVAVVVPAPTPAPALSGRSRWRTALRRATVFTSLAQRVVVVRGEPPAALFWDAQLAGVGIWVQGEDGALTECLAPAPFTPRRVKAAGWRFAEDAYLRVARV